MKTIITSAVIAFALSSPVLACAPTTSGGADVQKLHQLIRAGDKHGVRRLVYNHPNPAALCKPNTQGVMPHKMASTLYYAHDAPEDEAYGDIMRILRSIPALGFDCDYNR